MSSDSGTAVPPHALDEAVESNTLQAVGGTDLAAADADQLVGECRICGAFHLCRYL